MKRLFVIALLAAPLPPLFAQTMEEGSAVEMQTDSSPAHRTNERNIFNSLNLSVTAASTGFGLELATPVTDFLQLRVGWDFMPRFTKTLNVGVQVGEKLPGQTDAEYNAISQSKFDKLSSFLMDYTGHEVENNVDMIGRPSFHHFKLMVDIHPFAKATELKSLRNLYVTAGFYWGSAKMAEAYNSTENMPTLFSVNMYNGMYDKFMTDYYYYNDFLPGVGLDPQVIDLLSRKFQAWGRMGMHVGNYARDGEQRVYEEDVPLYDEYGIIVFDENDQPVIAHHQGEPMFDEDGNPVLTHYKGDPYMMMPDENCMVKANLKTRRFKPYIGIGYASDVSTSKSGWGFAVDAGVLFWGGTPSIITHDGTDLVHDLDHVNGSVGRYVNLAKKFKVYPVLGLKITRRLF